MYVCVSIIYELVISIQKLKVVSEYIVDLFMLKWIGWKMENSVQVENNFSRDPFDWNNNEHENYIRFNNQTEKIVISESLFF